MSQRMKRLLPLAMFLMTGALVAPANADLVHRLTTSTQLSVDGAATVANRVGSTYAVSGNNIKVASADDHFGKLVTPSALQQQHLMLEHTILTLRARLSASRKVSLQEMR